MRWLTTGTLAPAFRSCPSLSLSKLRLVGWRWIEGGFDRIVDALEPYEPDLVAGFFAHVLEVLAVARGSMTVEIPAWIAASTSSFTPPLGSTRPRSEISPVMAVSLRIVIEDRDHRRYCARAFGLRLGDRETDATRNRVGRRS
jgi:hypothetical protein